MRQSTRCFLSGRSIREWKPGWIVPLFYRRRSGRDRRSILVCLSALGDGGVAEALDQESKDPSRVARSPSSLAHLLVQSAWYQAAARWSRSRFTTARKLDLAQTTRIPPGTRLARSLARPLDTWQGSILNVSFLERFLLYRHDFLKRSIVQRQIASCRSSLCSRAQHRLWQLSQE